MSKPYVLYIRGMTCASCSSIIESFLKNSKSIKLDHFSVDVTTPDPKKATITLAEENQESRLVWEELKNLIEEIGYNCEDYDYNPLKEQNTSELPSHPLKKLLLTAKNIFTSHWFLGVFGCITGLGLMTISLVAGALPLAAIITLSSLSIVFTLGLGARSYYSAWKKWFESGELTMDTLFAISTIAVLLVSTLSFFVPWLPMMFEAGLLIYGFKHIGSAIQDTIKEKINSSRFQDRAPKVVRFFTENTLRSKKLADVLIDDVIEVHPGEIIPLDGICEDDGRIYNTIITGAPLPRYFPSGEKVFAGMRVAKDSIPLKIRVTRDKKNSYLARLDEGIAQSIREKTPLELKANRYLTYFIPTVLGVAVISGIIIGLFFPPALAIQCAISVLVSACPCTLGLITPLAVKTGMNKAAEKGVQFKNATLLELAEQINAVVFDLNGTLTTGVPEVQQFSILDNANLSSEDFLTLCCALEKKSSHPIGRTIYSFAKKGCTQEVTVTSLDDTHHSGRTGLINDQPHIIGSKTLMQEKGIPTDSIEAQLNLAAGDSLVYLAREQTLIGYFIITDPLRKDAVHTINALRKMGKEIHMCTGADEETAHRYAKALGINKVHAGCVATALEQGDKGKPAYIESLKKKGLKVAMIGDAANDARAIACSDFGIAVVSQDSDPKTQEEAGAIIHSGTLLPIASAFAISRQTVSNIKQNLLMSLGYNMMTVLVAGGLLAAVGFTLNPAVGVALMVIQACIILLNVYRFKKQSLDHLQENPALSSAIEIEEPSSHVKMSQHMPKHHTQIATETQAVFSEKDCISDKCSSQSSVGTTHLNSFLNAPTFHKASSADKISLGKEESSINEENFSKTASGLLFSGSVRF